MRELKLTKADPEYADTVRRLLTLAAENNGILWITDERGERIGTVTRIPARPVIQEEHGRFGVVS